VREKQHGKAFTEHEALHANKLLGLVHINVWGLAKTPSFGGEKYFVSFIADFFGKSSVYILKSKKECFSKFKYFQAVIENQTRDKIKILRKDNRGKFTSNEFQEFLKLHGMHHSTFMLYLPQQNGVVDQLHHTIVEGTISRRVVITPKVATRRSSWIARAPSRLVDFSCILAIDEPLKWQEALIK